MVLYFLFLFIAKSCAEDVDCNGLTFDHVYFKKEMLKGGFRKPYNLVLHKYSNILFFSHTINDGLKTDFEIISYDLKTRVHQRVNGIDGGYAIAYDPGNDDIYFGGHTGIYKYNFTSKSAEFFAEKGKSIWGLFIRRSFYYIEYPIQKLFVYFKEKFVKVAEAMNIEVDTFFISTHNDIYYSNRTALYKIERNGRQTIVLADDIAVRQIVEDNYGNIYFCGEGIYMENEPFFNVKRVAQADVFGMAFDEHDYVIYSDSNAIYRLIPSKESETCSERPTKEVFKGFLIK